MPGPIQFGPYGRLQGPQMIAVPEVTLGQLAARVLIAAPKSS